MTAPAITERLEELRAAARRERLSRFDPGSLLWLAAVPEWPMPLALAMGFPTGPVATVPDLVGELAAAGLVERRDVLDDDGEVVPVFWLPPSQRPDVGGHLQQVLGRGVLDGVRQLHDVLGPVGLAQPELLPPHWLEGAGTLLRDPSGAALNDLLDTWVRDERTAAAGEALAAAQAVGDVVGEPMASAARRGRWRLDRAYRQAHDERALRDYLPRPDLEAVLADLVQGRVGAVHLLGHGGVGKTMVIRHLASDSFALAHGLQPFPVARVDFDHLDPRYPETRPAELLIALAAELTGYTSTRGSFKSWRRFNDVAAALHEALAGSGGPAADVTDQHLDATADAFADYLDGLGGPVVLVLDTCEELAKLHAPGAPSPALDRTFDVVERVQARTGAARFLLAGRRRLVPHPGEPAGAGDILLRPRDYLKVVLVSGFSGPEAAAYIDHRDPGRRIGPDLRRAIVERCVTGDDINPFDLGCYVDWAVAEPGLDPATLRAVPGDPYVEQRILGRLTDGDVREAVPVAVLLGRFDRDMIAPTLARRGIQPDVAFSGLAGQEWMSSVSFHDDGRPRVVEVDEHLRPRLLTALRAWRDVDTHDLAADLRGMVSGRPVEDLPVEAVEAALRLLPPRSAGELWAEFELRIARADAWGWAAQVLPRVAAVAAELAEDREETVLGAILATQAAATLRQPGRPGLTELWSQVGALARRHPDPEQVVRLEYRSACGLMSSGPVRRPLPARRSGADLWSYVAAVDAFAMPDEFDELTRTADARAAATALLARATVTAAVEDVDAALARLDSADPGEFVEPIVDWVLPPRLRDRARLARTVLALDRGERPEDLPLSDWRAEALDHLHDIDSNRLAAATIALESAWRLPDAAFVAVAGERETYVPGRHATHHWHRRVDGLRAWVARSEAAFGNVDRAVAMLKVRREEAVAYGEDPDTITRCDATLVEMCRTYRTAEYTDSLHRLASDGPLEVAVEALAALALVDGDLMPVAPTRPTERSTAPRLAAQQAMRLGELLALTEPRDATPLLEDAVKGFHLVQDVRSEYRARILVVLNAARAGVLDEVRQRMGDPLPRQEGGSDRLSGGWPERERLARAVLAGDPSGVWLTSRSPELALPGVPPSPPRRPTAASPPPTGPPERERPMAPPPPADFPGAPTPRPVPAPADWASQPPPPSLTARPPARRRRRLLPAFLTLTPIALAVLAAVVVVQGEGEDPAPSDGPGRAIPPPESFDWGLAALVAGAVVLLTAGWFGRHRLARLRGLRRDRSSRGYSKAHRTGTPRAASAASAASAGPVPPGPRFRGPYHLAPAYADDIPAGAATSLLHLVGEPVPTAAGWRLRVQGTVSEGAQFSQSRGKYAGEELLDPGDVASDRPSLVVLQADPCDGPPQPLNALREGMIALGRAIRASSGGAVLIVPPAPDAMAREIIQRCADVGRRPYGISPGTIRDLAHEVRRLVGGDAGHDVMLID